MRNILSHSSPFSLGSESPVTDRLRIRHGHSLPALACSGHVRPSRPNRLRNAARQAPCPRRTTTAAKAVSAPVQQSAAALTSSGAIAAFVDLLATWKLAPARGWRMLTGLGYRAGSLTPDQIARVQHLAAIDAGMCTIRGDTVGEWMVASNGAAVLSGSSPVDFLTREGTFGYATRARQVAVWARM